MLMKLIKPFPESDWYCIERAEHDGREWEENRISDGWHITYYMRSARICNADVEGTLQEMVDLAYAIRKRRDEDYKRCCVEFVGDGFRLNSPRNSNDEWAYVSLEEADDLASQIEEEFKKVKL